MRQSKHFKFKLPNPVILPAIGGMLYALGFPHTTLPSFFFLPIIGFSLLLFTLSVSHRLRGEIILKHDLTALLFFSIGYYFTGYYWIPGLLQAFGNLPFPINHLVGFVFPFVILPQFIVFLLLAKLCSRINISFAPLCSSISQKNIIIAISLTILEYIIPQQFPAHMGHPWLQLAPYLGLSPIFGVMIFSFTGYWLATFLVSLIRLNKIDYPAILSIITIISINFLFPLEFNPDLNPTTKNNRIRLVQANIGNNEKVFSERGSTNAIDNVHKTYSSLSTMASEKKLDLVIWPETAYPGTLTSEYLKTNSDSISSIIRNVITETKAELFFGGYDINPNRVNYYFENVFNTGFLMAPNNDFSGAVLKDVYHKIKLIPFGETIPAGPLTKILSRYITNVSYFAHGNEMTLFETRNGTFFICAICYEILFPSFMRKHLNSLKRTPHFILNLTNDSWYGDTSEPYQHLFLAHWRALEFQMPIVRMTNTGITSILYPDGSESKRMPKFTPEIMDIDLKTPDVIPTIFQSWGIMPISVLWIMLFFIISLLSRNSKARTKPFL